MLTRRYLRKGPTATLVVLSLVAGLLLHLTLLLATDYSTSVEERAAELNAPEALAVTDPLPEGLDLAHPDLAEVEVTRARGIYGTFDMGGDEVTMLLVAFDPGAEQVLGGFAEVESAAQQESSSSVWLPSVFASSYDVGQGFTVETTAGSADLQVQGFIETIYGGAPTMGALFMQVPDSVELPGSFAVDVVKARGSAPDVAGAALDQVLGEHPQRWAQGLDLVLTSASLGADVFGVALGLFAVAMVGLSLVLVWFVLGRLLRRDQPSIAMLRAAGYTTWRVIGAVLLAFGFSVAVGALLGVGLSWLVLPAIRQTLEGQSGIGWDPGLTPLAIAGAVLPLVLAVLLVAFLAGLRIRRVSVVDALQGSARTEASSRVLPLTTTSGPLNVIVGLKSAMAHPAQQGAMALTVATLTFACTFVMGASTSLLSDSDKAAQVLLGESEDVSLTLLDPETDIGELVARVQSDPAVQDAFVSSVEGYRIEGRPAALMTADDLSDWRENPVVTGRLPEHPNEIAMGAPLASSLGLQVGDSYHLVIGADEATYLVTGIASTGRNLGQLVLMTTEAQQRLMPGFEPRTVVAYLQPDQDSAVATDTLREALADLNIVVTDTRSSIDAVLTGFLAAGTVVSVVVGLLTLAIIVAVIGLVVASLITDGMRRFGVFAAVGYTSRDLRAQVLWATLPTVLVAGLIGVAVAMFTGSKLLATGLAAIGVVTVDLPMPTIVPIGVLAAVALLGVTVSVIGARRLRRIDPTVLLTA